MAHLKMNAICVRFCTPKERCTKFWVVQGYIQGFENLLDFGIQILMDLK